MVPNSFRIGFFSLAVSVFFISCTSSRIKASKVKTDSFLQELFQQEPGDFQKVFSEPARYRVQIIYSQIRRDKKGNAYFTDYKYNVDPSLYFYPASTVKMPIALLALEKLHEIPSPVNFSNTMITMAKDKWQSPVYNDPLSSDGRPSIEQYVKKIFLVSDNDASNRLYEFVGQARINQRLREMGYDSTEILHRLSTPLSLDLNRVTNEVRFYEDSMLIFQKPSEISTIPRQTRTEALGKGYISGGKLIQQPFDFSIRNRMLLPDLHNMLRAIIFPDAVPRNQRFRINEKDRELVLKYMSEYPSKVGYPPYDSTLYWDTYCKFLLMGSEKKPVPPHIRIFNKVGDAYGFLTDVAYIVDTKNKVEFLLSVTIYCNEDGIFNDDKYEYETLGFPFMKHVGEVIYRRELEVRR